MPKAVAAATGDQEEGPELKAPRCIFKGHTFNLESSTVQSPLESGDAASTAALAGFVDAPACAGGPGGFHPAFQLEPDHRRARRGPTARLGPLFRRCKKSLFGWELPGTGGGSRGNGNSSFLLLLHPVHSCSTIMYFTNFMTFSCII